MQIVKLPDPDRVRAKRYRERHSEKVRAYKQLYYLKNKEQLNKKRSQYKRYVSKTLNTPKWLSRDQKLEIQGVYELCKQYTKITGVQYHVDHIIPLHGINVSGLHVPWNLRIITSVENLHKGRKYE